MYDIQYMYHGSFYKIRVISKSKSSDTSSFIIDKIFNECGEDISLDILPYLGPKYDFHGIQYTPIDFGHRKMTFLYTNFDTDTFHSNQPICLR